jgi:hypothetical protein
MLPNDEHFNSILNRTFQTSPFRLLSDHIAPEETVDKETLLKAFQRVFHSTEAKAAKNVVFIWAVDNPFVHECGNQLHSTISYIEITKGRLATRWPTRYLLKILHDKHRSEPVGNMGLQELAKKDKNFTFYSRLISEHGPLRVWYANLTELNSTALDPAKSSRTTVREWEKNLIKAYRRVHGCRPLKNRRD